MLAEDNEIFAQNKKNVKTKWIYCTYQNIMCAPENI